jgi:hypothetical protein
MLEHTDTIKLPTWALCAIAYGDMDGLTDHEENEIRTFLDTHPHAIFQIREEVYFTPNPEFGEPCDVVDCEIFEPVLQ